MSYTINPNAKNRWARNAENTMDLSLETDASSVYLDNGRTLEQEIGEGSMVSNVTTVDTSMSKVIDGTLDGAYESLMFKGKSLVNLATYSKRQNVNVQNLLDSNGRLSWNTTGAWGKVGFTVQGKPNSTYCVKYSDKHTTLEFYVRYIDGLSGTTQPITTLNSTCRKFTTDTTGIFTLTLEQGEATTDSWIQDFMIIEYQDGMENWDIPYFEGLCDVKMPILRSVGKNLAKAYINNETTETIENSYVKVIKDSTVTQDIDYTDKTEYIPIKPNTHYSCSWQLVSGSIQTKGSVSACFAFCDKNKEVIKWVSGANQLSPKNAYYIKRIRLHWGNTEATLKDFKFTMMLEENKSVTEFEPYKASILTLPEDVVLRKVGDVCDSYDALTGEYIQQIAEQTFNGSENWGKMDEATAIQNDTCLFTCYGALSNVPRDTKYLSDKYNITTNYPELLNTDKEMVHLYLDRALYFRISKSKLATVNINEFKQWLAQNPFTVQYQLETPITTTIEPLSVPFAYENGHIVLESGYEGQSLLPTLEYSTVVNKTGLIENVAKTIQRQEKQLTMLEKMLIQNIINLDYNNTLLTLKNEMEEML